MYWIWTKKAENKEDHFLVNSEKNQSFNQRTNSTDTFIMYINDTCPMA